MSRRPRKKPTFSRGVRFNVVLPTPGPDQESS